MNTTYNNNSHVLDTPQLRAAVRAAIAQIFDGPPPVTHPICIDDAGQHAAACAADDTWTHFISIPAINAAIRDHWYTSSPLDLVDYVLAACYPPALAERNTTPTPTAAITAITDAITDYRSDGYARTILIDPTTGTAYPTPTPPPNHPVYATWDSIAAYADKWLDDPAATPATLATGFVDLYHRDALDAITDQLASL